MDPSASETLEKNCLCLALTRRGTACERAPTPGKRRCWYHGGGGRERGSGAPEGEANGAYRHGRYTRARREEWLREVAERQEREREWRAKMSPANYPPGWVCDWYPGAPRTGAHPPR